MSKLTDLMGLGLPDVLAAAIDANSIGSEPTRTVSTGLTATGTVLADALALVSHNNVVSTTALNTGVKLPDAVIGSIIFVQNNGANPLNLFPPTSSGTLNGGSAGAAVTIAAAAGNMCVRLSSTDWLVTVFAKET